MAIGDLHLEGITAVLASSETVGGAAWGGADRLSGRERAVLRLAEAGRSNKEIADALSLSPGTVRNYLHEAAGKLGADNRVEAARIARANGWL